MTIVTKPNVDQKKDEKAFLANCDAELALELEAPNEVQVEDPIKKRNGFVKLITLVIVITIGFTAGLCLFNSLHASRFRRGFCRLPFDAKYSAGDGTFISGKFWNVGDNGRFQDNDREMPESLVSEMKETVSKELVSDKDGGVGLEYEVDIEMETFEMTQMPQLSHGIYVHDFKVNKTLILDNENDRCFIMDLDRNEIEPPKTFMDVINKLRNGAYNLDFDEIRHDTRVVLPPLDSVEFSDYGVISTFCRGMTSYKLEDIGKILVKRSAEELAPKTYQYIEFAGKNLIEYNIVNLHDL